MKTKRSILLGSLLALVLILIVPKSTIMADDVYWDDGGSHTINDDTYRADWVYLDYYTANDPGTHADLVDGGEVGILGAYNNATITMTGGWADYISCYGNSNMTVTGGLTGVSAHDTSTINISGGDIGAVAWDNSIINIYDGANVSSAGATDYGHIYIYGGIIDRASSVYDSIIDIYGGTINNSINACDNAVVNVYGYDLFLTSSGGSAGYGTLIGYLQDGSPIDVYLGNSETYLHINLVPEPSMLSLFVMGLLGLSRRKR